LVKPTFRDRQEDNGATGLWAGQRRLHDRREDHPLSANSLRWIMTSAGEPLVPAESDITRLDPDEAVVDIDACASWCTDLDYHFGGAHIKHASLRALRHEVSGRVVEAGANALYYTDRAVVLAVIPPKHSGEGCAFGAATFCLSRKASGNQTDCGCGNTIIVPARELYLAEKLSAVSSRSGRMSPNDR
jgi:6-hydroxycyclohex-1-ene-1-carbonyl-CoA dehydrogenase